MATTFESIFKRDPEVFVQAPGRVELLGNHLDYNGGLVMGFAIEQVVRISAARRSDQKIVLASTLEAETVETEISTLAKITPSGDWEKYPLGVCREMQLHGMELPQGFDLFVESNVPAGAGLSSSAALEVATACALSQIYQYPLEALTMAKLCQAAENKHVGVPCGILDQTVSACSQENHITLINCQAEAVETVEIAQRPVFWIFNTSKKHRLLDSLYSKRHQECSDVYKALCLHIEARNTLIDFDLNEIDSIRSRISADAYKRAFHVCNEQKRVQQAVDLIRQGDLKELGTLLNASHASSQEYFENSCDELDFLVARLNDQAEVYGARLSGGGFGGACIAMASDRFSQQDADIIAQQYQKEFGSPPQIVPTRLSNGPLIHKLHS